MDWFWHNKGQGEVESFVTLCWQIWQARNEVIFKGIFDPPSLFHRKALKWLKEYQQALSFELCDVAKSRYSVAWCHPYQGDIKINLNGAFSPEIDKHGFGFVA